jgi:cystathionine beta-synthase
VGDLIAKRGPRELVTIYPDSTVADAIGLMQTKGISQLPIVHEGKSVGCIQEVTLARVLHDMGNPEQVKIGDVMARPLPTVEVTVHLDEAYRLLLSGHTGVLALNDGKIVDIVTRIDLVNYYQHQRANG